jgi:cardiolipin synthase
LIPGRWRRLHRKLCVVDGAVAFCGGINVLDDLEDPGLGTLAFARFDFALRITGPLVSDIHQAMAQFWGRLMATQRLERMQLEGVRLALHDARTPTAAVPVGMANDPALGRDMRAALLLRDNVLNRSRIERAYRKAIAEAQQEVLIANAYFLPGGKLRRALIHAARRGVRVRLLLQGRYEYFMQFHASRPVYGALLDAGIEIHEYQSGFLHAKVAVIDSRWATVGSSNLDPLSLLLAREANVMVDDAPFAQALRTQVLAAMQEHGVLLDPQTAAMRPWRQRFLDGLAYGIMRLVLYVTGKRY